jgi:hypothetical protein
MSMKLQLMARDLKTETTWKDELKTLSQSVGGALADLSHMVFVDAKRTGWQDQLGSVDRTIHSVVLILEEHDFLPDPKSVDLVDDLLVYPFRIAEMLSIFKHHQTRQAQTEILNEVQLAQDDVQNSNEMLERILHAKTPKRYTNIKGLQVMSKHLSGLKPGGDYFDVFESTKKDFVNILLVDSSSYGISAAFLGLILSSSARIANDAQLSTADWVKTIFEELKVTLGDQGHFSVFFGRLNRKDFSLHYQLYGTIEAFVVEKEGECHSLQKHGKRISAKTAPADGFEKIIHLSPKDRIVLLSDGFVNGVGGEFYLQKLFHERLNQEPFALVNELSFQIKSKLSPGETFPGEDCSAIVIDVDHRVLRLAPTG